MMKEQDKTCILLKNVLTSCDEATFTGVWHVSFRIIVSMRCFLMDSLVARPTWPRR